MLRNINITLVKLTPSGSHILFSPPAFITNTGIAFGCIIARPFLILFYTKYSGSNSLSKVIVRERFDASVSTVSDDFASSFTFVSIIYNNLTRHVISRNIYRFPVCFMIISVWLRSFAVFLTTMKVGEFNDMCSTSRFFVWQKAQEYGLRISQSKHLSTCKSCMPY